MLRLINEIPEAGLKNEVFTISKRILRKEREEVSLPLYQLWESCFLLTHEDCMKNLI